MLRDFIDELQALCGDASIRLDRRPAWLSDYLKEDVVVRGMARLAEDRHAVETTAALFEDQKIVPLESHDSGWTSMLLTINREASSMSTAAGAAVVHIVEAPSPLRFALCPVEGVVSFEDLPSGARLGPRTDVMLVEGDTFVVPQGTTAIQLRGTSCRVKLLRFNGPISAPLTLAFEPATGRMTSASFSRSEMTGRHFFSVLVSELARPGAFYGADLFPSDEKAGVAALIEGYCGSDDVHPFTKWRLAQTLARIKPAAAIGQLDAMVAAGPPNLRRFASAALAKHKEMAA